MSEKNQPEKDHFWKTSMRTLMARKIVIEIEEKLPGLLDEWYRDHGMETPPWRQNKPYFDDDGNIVRPD